MALNDGPPSRRIVIPAVMAGGAVLAAGAVIVLLVLMLASINNLERGIARTNDRLVAANERIENLNRKVDPVAELAPPVLRRARPFLGNTREDLRETTEGFLPALKMTTRDIAGAVIPFTNALNAGRLSDTAATVDRAAARFLDLLSDRPVGETFSAAVATLARVDELDLPGDADRGLEALPPMRRSIAEIEDDISQARESLRDSVRVQCLLLDHVASIDRKTGGEIPPEPEPDRPPRQCRDVRP